MAKKNRKHAEDESMVEGFEETSEVEGTEEQETEARGVQGSAQGGMNLDSQIESGIDTVRNFVEGNPLRAVALGAAAGGLLGGLFATETGRMILKTTFGYAKPVLAEKAREFAGNQAASLVEGR